MIRVAQFSGPEPDKRGIFGEPGDQLDSVRVELKEDELREQGEVNIIELDPKAWTKVFRPVMLKIADTLAEQMYEAALNPNVGYSQGATRYSFGDALLEAGTASNIPWPVNGDCSSGVSGILRAAGIPVRRGMVTATEEKDLLETGEFIVIDDPGYLSDPANYKRGDVLWRSGHTAVCIDSGSFRLPAMIATGYCYRRIGAGTGFRIIGDWHKGEELRALPGLCAGKWIITTDLTGDNRGFTSIKNLDGLSGYGAVKVTALAVRIRELPSLDADTIKYARRGQIYVATGCQAEDERGVTWYEIETGDRDGWISSKYCVEVEE